jgi:hypothetical protein
MEFDPDRPRGVLSPADREFLLGLSEMSHDQSRRNAEARIRERVTNGILDFYLLVRHLKRKDRRQIFDKNLDDTAFRYGLVGMVTFCYMGCKEQGMEFEPGLEPAIRRAEEVYAAEGFDSTVDVDVTFDVTAEPAQPIDDVAESIREGRAVTPGEFLAVMAGETEVLGEVDAVLLRLGVGDVGLDEDEFVARIASFMDGDLEWLDDDRVRVHIGSDVESPGSDSASSG